MDKYWSLLTEALTQECNPSVKRFPDAGTLDAAATTVAPILPCGGGVPFTKLKVLDLFSGIGGFSLGLERTNGFETVAFCEINPFCRRVLEKHWPGVRKYDDVETLTAAQLAADNIRVDVISGGFPCQDVSSAGRRAGIEGSRTGLWKHVIRLAGELRPKLLLLENVTGLLEGERGAWFGRVLGDLAEIGFDAEWHCIPASAIGGLHERDRVWITAYPNTDSLRLQGVWGASPGTWPEEQFTRLVQVALRDAVPTRNGRGIHDGISDRAHKLHALGNAVVPQIPELIGNAILKSLENAGGQLPECNRAAAPMFVPFHSSEVSDA